MKVYELIEILKAFNQDAEIANSYDGQQPLEPIFEWSDEYQAYIDYEG